MWARVSFSVVLGIAAISSTSQAWTTPVPLAEINSAYHDKAPFLSFDGLTLYYAIEDGPGWSGSRIYQATRNDPAALFTSIQEVSTLNPGDHEHASSPWVSPDNLRMYYYRTEGTQCRLEMAERNSAGGSWLPRFSLNELNALGYVANPTLTADELTIVFAGSNLVGGRGGYDLWTATRPNRESAFSNVRNLSEINSTDWDYHPSISPDGLTLYFGSRRNGWSQIFQATRSSGDALFDPPELLPLFPDQPTVYLEYPSITSDGKTLYFAKRKLGGDPFDIYFSSPLGTSTVYDEPVPALPTDPAPVQVDWISQFANPTAEYWCWPDCSYWDDEGHDVVADRLGNTYVASSSRGNVMMVSYAMKFDAKGKQSWSRQLVDVWSGQDRSSAEAIATDSLGNLYVAGWVSSYYVLGAVGGEDAFVTSLDPNTGSGRWAMRTFGTIKDDRACGVSVDSQGGVYVAGYTAGSLGGPNAGMFDAFVRKFNSTSLRAWTQQFGTHLDDRAWDVSADGLGNVFVVGETKGALGGVSAGGSDAFVSKFDPAGILVWTRQFGTNGDDQAYDVCTDGMGNAYVCGRTEGSMAGGNAGGHDGFLSKVDSAGNLLWTRQFGTAKEDEAAAVWAHPVWGVWVAGDTGGGLVTEPNAVSLDAFVGRLDAAGNWAWIKQLGTDSTEFCYGMAGDEAGSLYLTGSTSGNLGGPIVGGIDAYLAKLTGAFAATTAD